MVFTPSTVSKVEQSSISTLGGDILYVGGGGPGNYSKIQDAIDDASNGDTVFVYDDSSPYYETIDIISKTINLIGENRDTTIIDGDGNGNVIHAITCFYLNISGFTIRNAGYLFEEKYLIYMVSCEYCNISYNICNDNPRYTIILKDSHDNQIFNNIAKRNSVSIILFDSKRNTIAYNYLSNSWECIKLHRSPDNIIHHNNIYKNYVTGLYLEDSPNCNIYMNNIEKNRFIGISLDESDSSFYCNNFIRNTLTIVIQFETGSYEFDRNYWNRPRSISKLILGWRSVMMFPPEFFYPHYPGLWILVPKIIFDKNPATEPYDIGGMI